MEKPDQTSSARTVFGSNLRKIRRDKEITQEQLALRTGMSRTYISEVERFSRNISIDNMESLANCLDISLSDLLDPKLNHKSDG
jgi:transcriptional regulator with XRE-family HTH domain